MANARDIEDKEIIKGLKEKNQQAASWLYDKYSPLLFGLSLKILRSKAWASDALQETMIKIWNKAPQFDSEHGRFFSWMYTIARNNAIDMRRSAAYKAYQKNQTIDSSVYEDESRTEEPTIRDHGLQEVLKGLEPKYQDVLKHVYFLGYTHQETSDELEIPLGTVKSRVRTALRKLRGKLGDEKIYLFFGLIQWMDQL